MSDEFRGQQAARRVLGNKTWIIFVPLLGFLLFISFGTSVLVSMLASAILTCAAILVMYSYNLVCAVALAIIGQNYGLALFIHLILRGALDRGLQAPFISYAYATLFCVSITIIALLIGGAPSSRLLNALNVGGPRARAPIVMFLVGLLAALASGYVASEAQVYGHEVSGAGIFYKYQSFIVFPIVTAIILGSRRRPRWLTGLAYSAFGAAFLYAIILNGRKLMVDVAIGMALAYLFGTQRRHLFGVACAAAAALFVFSVLSPMITLMRFDVRGVPVLDRPTFIAGRLPLYLEYLKEGRLLNEETRGALQAKYLDYAGRGPVLQRLSGIQMTDFALSSTSGTVGWGQDDPMAFGLNQALPPVFVSEKAKYSFGDFVTWRLGLRPAGVRGYPYVPLLSSTIASYGAPIGLMIAIFLSTVALAMLHFLHDRLVGSGVGILLFVAMYNSLTEGDAATYVVTLCRTLPELGAALVLIGYFFQRRVVGQTPPELRDGIARL